jgi:hypothetical protein
MDLALAVDRQHPLHGFLAIEFGKAFWNGRVVEVDQLNAPPRVKTA